MEILELENFSFKYALSQSNNLSNISMAVNEGDIILIFGESGCGKSTLLKCLKEEILPVGALSGKRNINVNSKDIAIVLQNIESIFINNKVIDEIVFQMENRNYSKIDMQKSLAEIVNFFGIENLLDRDISTLSGGEKQIVSICSALVIKPKLLLIDEPLSQLDPIMSDNFIRIILRINRELGITIILSEHKLDNIINLCNKVIFLNNGSIIYNGYPKNILTKLYNSNIEKYRYFIPSIPYISLKVSYNKKIFFEWVELKKYIEDKKFLPSERIYNNIKDNLEINLHNIYFAFENSTHFILNNLNLKINKNEKICLLGSNGSGKTTLLKILTNIEKPFSGSVKIKYKVGYMPQDVKTIFRFKTVLEELDFSSSKNIDMNLIKNLDIENILNKNPLDLSEGEMVKVALACMIMSKSMILLLDEPTKGLDPVMKNELINILNNLNKTIIIVTHDMEFAVDFATRCIMLFNGSIILDLPTDKFFSDNIYYTTYISKCFRDYDKSILSVSDVILDE